MRCWNDVFRWGTHLQKCLSEWGRSGLRLESRESLHKSGAALHSHAHFTTTTVLGHGWTSSGAACPSRASMPRSARCQLPSLPKTAPTFTLYPERERPSFSIKYVSLPPLPPFGVCVYDPVTGMSNSAPLLTRWTSRQPTKNCVRAQTHTHTQLFLLLRETSSSIDYSLLARSRWCRMAKEMKEEGDWKKDVDRFSAKARGGGGRWVGGGRKELGGAAPWCR